MARGSYLGKISAIVSINTASVRPSLNTAAKDVDQWAKRADSSIRGAAQSYERALKGIFTPLQRLQAAIKTANSNPLSFQIQNAQAFTQLAKATEQIAKPLGQVQSQFAGLANSVQAELLPVLQSAQKQTTSLFNAISSGAKVSDRDLENTAARVQRLTAAIARANEAQSLARGGRTGRELAFVAPRVQDELSRSSQLSQRAAEAPVSLRADPSFRQRIEELDQLRQGIVRYQAAVDRRQVLGLDTREAQAQLDSLIRRSADARRAIEQVTSGSDSQLIARAKAQQEFYAESERLQKQAAADSAAPLIARARAEQEYYAESERLQRQAAADAAAPLIARARAEREFYSESRRLQNEAAADAAAPLIARARAEQDFYTESKRLQEQAAADAAAPLIARARAEQDFYAESQRLQKQAATDAAAPLIARARAEQDFYAESERLQKQAAADEAAILIARARAQQEFEAERDRLQKQAAEDSATPLIRRAQADRATAIDFGLDLDAPRRQIEVLRGSIVSLKGQIDGLPASLRTQFVPAIFEAERNLERLAQQPAAAAEEIARAEAELNRLSASATRASRALNFRRSLGGENIEDFNLNLQERSLNGYTAQLRVLQDSLSRTSAEARGPAVASFIALQNAISAAFEEGRLDSENARGEIRRLTNEAVRAAAEVAGVSRGGLARQITRAGDIGRGGFDKFSLALNQAAFAVDDFLSSTGGLEFKLRAISNNITQLAFVLGGTTGLFAGLAAVIGGQALVAITRWVNEGRTAADQTKALNDALTRQKSLAEDLRQAFESLGDTLTRDAFSPAAQQANQFRREIEEIVEKQKELREARLSDLDPTVQRERATQGSLQRRLDTETDIGRRVALQQQIEESRRREREAARAAAAAPAANGAQAAVAIERAGQALFDQRTRGEDTVTPRDTAVLEAARARAGNAARGGGPQAIRDALVQQRDALFASGAAETDAAVAESLRELEALIRSLENPIRRAVDALAVSVLEGAQKTADALARAQQSIVDAGLPQSRIAREADAVAKNLKEIADQITPEADEATIAALKQQEEALRKNAAALESAARSVELFSAGLDRNSRQLSDTVLQEADSREMQARRNLNAAAGSVFLDRGIADGSISSLSGGVAPSLRANGVRNRERRFEEAQEDRRRARAELARRRSVQQEFELTRSSAVRQFEEDALSGNLGDQAKQLIEQRDKARAAIEGGGLDAGQMATQERNLAQAMAGLAAIFAESPIAASLERWSNSIDAAAQRAAEVTQRIEDERASVSRGEELSKTPGQRAREELDQQLQDIRNFFSQAAEESTGLPEDVAEIRAKMEEALNRTTEDAKRSVAPAVFALQDAVQNAILQGPSRAALNAADVSTMEGSRELNRLLRGDDPARDVNLLELQKQTKLLEDLVEREPPPII